MFIRLSHKYHVLYYLLVIMYMEFKISHTNLNNGLCYRFKLNQGIIVHIYIYIYILFEYRYHNFLYIL